MDARRRGGAALAVALALACAAPPGTAHAEQLVRTYAEGEAVPGGLVLDGEAYELSGWEPGGGLGAATRTFERTAYKTLPAADYGGDPAACFDAEMAVEEEGFSGAIALVGARAEVSSSHPERSDYEEAVEFSYITKAELDALPATRRATVAGRELELGKLDVQYLRVPSDPGTEIYSGRAVYGIHEQRDVPDEYKLTATYAGELSRGAMPATVVAVYEPVPQGPAPDAAAPEGAPQADAGSADPFPKWLPAVPAAIAIAACAALALACARLLKPGKATAGEEGGKDDEDPEAPAGGGRPEGEEENGKSSD